MKITLSIKEALAIEKSMQKIQTKINEMDGEGVVEALTIKKVFSELKNNAIVKFRLFEGIEVSVREDYITDFIQVWTDGTILLMPSFKALYTLIENFRPLFKQAEKDYSILKETYADDFATITDELILCDEEIEPWNAPF